jgi:hypothetical protein
MVGHRAYIGGRWDEWAQVEFDFMVSHGLEPQHVLLDIACGALRAGVHFIPYLDTGNHLGVEKERALIRRGLTKELPREAREEKQPELLVTDKFEFERLSKQADFALAWSLFTRLTPGPRTVPGEAARARGARASVLRELRSGRQRPQRLPFARPRGLLLRASGARDDGRAKRMALRAHRSPREHARDAPGDHPVQAALGGF